MGFRFVYVLFFLIMACKPDSPYSVEKGVSAESIQVKLLAENISTEEARSKIGDRERVVKSIFKPSYDPYTGQESIPDKCAENNLPGVTESEIDGNIAKAYHLYSSANKSFGNCINPKELLKTQYALVYCKNFKKLYSVTYYYPDSSKWLKKPVIFCN